MAAGQQLTVIRVRRLAGPLTLHGKNRQATLERPQWVDSHPPAISEIIATPAVPRLRKSIHPGFSSQKRWRIPPE